MNKNKLKNKKNPLNLRKIIIAGVLVIAVSALLFANNKNEQETESDEIVVTDANFDKIVLKSDKLVIVDFWATWCGPCKMMAPVVNQIAGEYKGKVVVGKLDVDQNNGTATNYGIMSIPTILFFKNGKVVDSEVGVVPKEQLEQKIKLHLNN